MCPDQGTIGVSAHSHYALPIHPSPKPPFLPPNTPHLLHIHIHLSPHYQNSVWPILETSTPQRFLCHLPYRPGWYRWKKRLGGVTSSWLGQTSSWQRHTRWSQTETLSCRLKSQRYRLGDEMLRQGLIWKDGWNRVIHKWLLDVHLWTPKEFPFGEDTHHVGHIVHESGIGAQMARWLFGGCQRRQSSIWQFATLFKAVQEGFRDPDRRSTKIYKLHTIAQGDKTVDKHVQSFKKAACGLGYSGYTLVEEFKHSLNTQLREQVSNLDRIPETIDRWYQQAMHLDRQWRQAKK